MEPETKEKIKLTAREILLTFCDGIAKIEEILGYSWQRKEAREYWQWRDLDKDYYYKKLWELEKRGYIKRYKKEKKSLIKLTPLGETRALKYVSDRFKIKTPKVWDKKWRMVIFDIPKDKKVLREIIREKLTKLGFYPLQKSVFVYPFDCHEIVTALKYIYNTGPYVQYIVAEAIETEIDLLSYFYDQGILTKRS